MNKHSNVMDNHIKRPYNNRSLIVAHGTGTVADVEGRNAVKMAFAMDSRERIADVGFRAFGESRLLTGCASFLSECMRGQTVRWMNCVTPSALFNVLRVSRKDFWCVSIVVHAMWAALQDYRSRRKVGTQDGIQRGVTPQRRGTGSFSPPPPTPLDMVLLWPGETITRLLEERAYIFECLTNLDLCLQVGLANQALPQSHACNERERLPCDLASLKMTVPHLSPADRQLIARVGVQGRPLWEVAGAMGVMPHEVQQRLWAIAREVQRIERRSTSGGSARMTGTVAAPASA